MFNSLACLGDSSRALEAVKRRRKPSPFLGSISAVFEQFMYIYVKAQEKNLNTMLETFLKSFAAESSSVGDGARSEEAKTLESSGDMFRFFRECMITVRHTC